MNIKNLISAKIVADSKNAFGDRLTTMELIFPRMILAELNTHRMFTRNSASSRAIPFDKMVKSVMETPFVPMAWQKNHSGMQGTEYHLDDMYKHAAVKGWLRARDKAVYEATLLNKSVNITKQLVNRLLEPFLYHKVLLTFTESENFFNLRSPQYDNHNGYGEVYDKSKRDFLNSVGLPRTASDYDEWITEDWLSINKGMGEIHIMELAEKMWDAMKDSTPRSLNEGEYHLPYGDDLDDKKISDILKGMYDIRKYGFWGQKEIEEFKIKVVTARCARLSYQTLGDNPKIDYKADLKLYKTLYDSGHFSPFEHIGRAMSREEYYTHVRGIGKRDVTGNLIFSRAQYGWSNNFKGFIQNRATLEVS